MEEQRKREQIWTMKPAPSRPTTAPRDFEKMPTVQLEEELERRGLSAAKADDKKQKNKPPAREQLIETLGAAAEIDAVAHAGALGAPADDSLAIQTAMNAMHDGQVLRFPPGRYMVQHLVLPHSVNITLAGPEVPDNNKKNDKKATKGGRGAGSSAVLELIPGGRFILSTAALPVVADEDEDEDAKPKEGKKKTVAEQLAEAKANERKRELAASGIEAEEDDAAGGNDDADSICGGSDMRPGIEIIPGDGKTIEDRPRAADSVLRKRVYLRNLTLEGPKMDKPASEPTVGGVRCEDTPMHKQAWQSKKNWQNKGGGNTAFPDDKVNGSKLSSGECVLTGYPLAASASN